MHRGIFVSSQCLFHFILLVHMLTGLYSLAKRVEALGGYYGVRKRENGKEGSLFWFAVPYVPDSSEESVPTMTTFSEKVNKSTRMLAEKSGTNNVSCKAAATSNVMNSATSTKNTTMVQLPKLNILLVDDSLTILKMTTSLLKRHGHLVTQAENGAEALTKLAERATAIDDGNKMLPPFDVVLMDLNMPVMDGLEATTRLRATENNLEVGKGSENAPLSPPLQLDHSYHRQHQFVVGFSANSDHQTMTEAYTAGVDDFICKPFALQTFYDAFHRHKHRQQQRK